MNEIPVLVCNQEIDGSYKSNQDFDLFKWFQFLNQSVLTDIGPPLNAEPTNFLIKTGDYILYEVKAYNPNKESPKNFEFCQNYATNLKKFFNKCSTIILPFFAKYGYFKDITFHLVFFYNGDFSEDRVTTQKIKEEFFNTKNNKLSQIHNLNVNLIVCHYASLKFGKFMIEKFSEIERQKLRIERENEKAIERQKLEKEIQEKENERQQKEIERQEKEIISQKLEKSEEERKKWENANIELQKLIEELSKKLKD